MQTAIDYARRVLEGEIFAGKWVRRACERFLNDLRRAEADPEGFPYRFDVSKAQKACGAIALFPHIRGQLAGKPLELSDWQAFILANVFGWVEVETGLRRFRKAYVEVPRKNGKSTLTAAVGLYMLALDGEPGAEVYSAATSRDQARIVFDTARLMAEASGGFCRRFGVSPLANSITAPGGAFFKPLAAVDKTLEGLNPHCAIIDELHAHPTRRVYDVLNTALGARSQPLLWVITTAGDNRSGVCFEQHRYIEKLLDGAVEDEASFGIIFTLDDADDWTDEATWQKANPNYGISVGPQMLKSACAQARVTASLQNSFKTRHLGIWVNAAAAWMDMRRWQDCADEGLCIDDFAGEPCIIGLDLASKKDVASKVRLFWRNGADGRPRFYLFAEHYLPEEAVVTSAIASYAGWQADGYLKVTPGPITDIDAIEQSIRDDATRFELREVAYDPHQATQLSNRLAADGFCMVEVRPSVLNFSEPMKELEALTLDGRLIHDGDPVLSWMRRTVD